MLVYMLYVFLLNFYAHLNKPDFSFVKLFTFFIAILILKWNFCFSLHQFVEDIAIICIYLLYLTWFFLYRYIHFIPDLRTFLLINHHHHHDIYIHIHTQKYLACIGVSLNKNWVDRWERINKYMLMLIVIIMMW